MFKTKKDEEVNLYYMNDGQNQKETIDDLMKRKKEKEREKRIKKEKQKKEEDFDQENQTVIQMTNKNRLKQEEQRRKKLSKQERKRKKRNKRIKFILKLVILIGLIVGSIVFALTSPIFNIKDIQVTNNNAISGETIISLSGLSKDQNIFKFKTSDVINKIKENPYIEEVKVNRKFPSTVQIEVKERTATYSVDFLGKYAYINNQGYILEISEDKKGMPVIQGISTKEDQVVPNNRLNNEDLEKLEDVIKIMNASKENGLER